MDKWWTEEDDLFLKNNYLLLGPKECAKQLNRTYGSTVSEAARLGITSKNNYSAEASAAAASAAALAFSSFSCILATALALGADFFGWS